MDGITSLKEAIRTVPIPGSPPPGSREGAAVGLAGAASRLIGAADFSRNRGWQHRSVQPATTQT
jgi:hypothetical protein